MHRALEITINEDKLSATMLIKKTILATQKELAYPTVEDVMVALEESDVVYGIDKEKIADNLKFKDTPVVIAKGKPMVSTIHDKVSYTFEDVRNKQFTPTILANDKANFYDVINMPLVQKNELLVFVKKGRAGSQGMTVHGKELIPEKYMEIFTDRLKTFQGSNTELSTNGIVSTTCGIPLIAIDGKAHVDESYVVKGDVDFETGSVEFQGPVIVKGSVTNHFKVITPKDIIIEGIVDGGILEAGGMITILGGAHKATINCKKNLAAKYVYGSTVKCEGTVIVDEAIMNSNITAKTVIAKGQPSASKSGQISGGVVRASNFIWSKSMGSPSSNYTEIYIQSLLDKNRLDVLNKERDKVNEELVKIFKTLKLIEELKKKATNLPPEFKLNEVRLIRTRLALEKKNQQLKTEIANIKTQVEDENTNSMRRVFVTAALYSQVQIQIMEMKLYTTLEYGPSIVMIEEEDNSLKISPAVGKMELPKGFN